MFLGVIASIKTLKTFPWEERGHGHSHNITFVILSKEQGNNRICAYFRIGMK